MFKKSHLLHFAFLHFLKRRKSVATHFSPKPLPAKSCPLGTPRASGVGRARGSRVWPRSHALFARVARVLRARIARASRRGRRAGPGRQRNSTSDFPRNPWGEMGYTPISRTPICVRPKTDSPRKMIASSGVETGIRALGTHVVVIFRFSLGNKMPGKTLSLSGFFFP